MSPRTRTGAAARARSSCTIDGETVSVPEGTTILAASRKRRASTSRRCATEPRSRRSTPAASAWSRSRARACSCRRARARSRTGMVVADRTPSACDHSRKMVLELLGLVGRPVARRRTSRAGSRSTAPTPSATGRRRRRSRPASATACAPATTTTPDGEHAATVAPAGEGRQRALRARLREVHPLLQVRRGVRHRLRRTRSPSPSPAAGSTPASPPSSPTRCPTRPASTAATASRVCPTGALMFKSEHDMREAGTWDEARADATRHDLPVLRRRLQARAARAGQRDRQGHLAARPRGHARQPLHQGPLRLPVRPERPRRTARRWSRAPTPARSRERQRRTKWPPATIPRDPRARARSTRRAACRSPARTAGTTSRSSTTTATACTGSRSCARRTARRSCFTMPDFVEQGDELGEIALLVIRARSRWRELKGVGG